LTAFLSRFSPETVALAKRCLLKLRRTFPGTNQIVYDYNHSVVVSFSQSEHGYEGIVTLAIYPREVRLYFLDGKSLPDPQGRLQGSGTKVRFATLEAASDLDHADVHALIKAAIKHSGAKFPRTGSNPMIIKPASKKKKKAKKAGRGA